MSRRVSHLNEDGQRNDSAMSLALDHRPSSHTSASRRGPASSPSWSSYNLRQDSLTDSTYETPASSVHEYVDIPLTPALLPDTSTSASTLQASTSLGDMGAETVPCGQCHIEFTGTYRRGNLARHVRLKHRGISAEVYSCRAGACFRVFKRQDARLKHERNTHPELYRPPPQVRFCSKLEMSATDFLQEEPVSYAAGLDSHVSVPRPDAAIVDVEDDTLNSAEGALHDRVNMLPAAAWRTFYEIHAGLDPAKYSQLCDTLFARWATLAQALKDQKSHAYDAFARSLADLHHVVEAIDCNVPEHDSDEGQRQVPPHSTRRSPSGTQHASANICPARSSSMTHSSARHSQRQRDRKGQSSKVTTSRHYRTPDLQTRELDCPVYKNWFMHFQATIPPPCNGCSEQFMAQIRNHLKRSHVGQRGEPIPYYYHCVRCNENFVDYISANDHRSSTACAHVAEPRGDPVIPWAKLYLKVYPDATAIPLPYTGEPGWMPPSVLTRCQQVTRAFLGQRFPTQAVPTPPGNLRINVNDQLPYEAFQETMLQETIGQAAILGMGSLSPYSQGLTYNRLAFIGQLSDAQTRLLRLLSAAPRYLSGREIVDLVSALDGVSDIARAYERGSMTPAALSFNTLPSADGMHNDFSDLALSPQTDQTTAPDTNALGPSGRNEAGESPLEGADSQGAASLAQHGPDDLAFFDLGPDIGGGDVSGSLDFRHGC